MRLRQKRAVLRHLACKKKKGGKEGKKEGKKGEKKEKKK